MGEDDTKLNAALSAVAPIVAVVVVVLWLAMLAWLVFQTNASEVTWARLLVVLGSLEAVVFAAAGAMFGTTIQRQRVADAKEQAAKAEGKAEAHARNAENGRVLAEHVKARAVAPPAAGGSQPTATVHRDDDLVALARRLFPD